MDGAPGGEVERELQWSRGSQGDPEVATESDLRPRSSRTEAPGWTGFALRSGSRIPYPRLGPTHPRNGFFVVGSLLSSVLSPTCDSGHCGFPGALRPPLGNPNAGGAPLICPFCRASGLDSRTVVKRLGWVTGLCSNFALAPDYQCNKRGPAFCPLNLSFPIYKKG